MSDHSTSSRALAAPLIIAATVIAGGHMMLVDPAKRQLAKARADTVQLELEQQRFYEIQSALPAVTAVGRQAAIDAGEIERGNTLARDTGLLFATLADIAKDYNVRVDQLDPFIPKGGVVTAPVPANQAGPGSTGPASPPAPGAPPQPADIQLGYSMTVVATYSDLAAFLREMQSSLGYTRILSARIAPSPEGPEVVSARIQTVHHAFSLPVAKSLPDAQAPEASR